MELTTIPWWVAALLIPTAIWARDSVWPWLRGLVDAEFKERRAQRTIDLNEERSRYLEAFEMSAQAQKMQAENGKEVAAALRVIGETRVADNLTLQRLERQVEQLIYDGRPRARARGHTEGERGE